MRTCLNRDLVRVAENYLLETIRIDCSISSFMNSISGLVGPMRVAARKESRQQLWRNGSFPPRLLWNLCLSRLETTLQLFGPYSKIRFFKDGFVAARNIANIYPASR